MQWRRQTRRSHNLRIKVGQRRIQIAQDIDSTLTPAFQNLFDAILKGQNPIKAFFNSIVQGIEQVIAKLVSLAIEKFILKESLLILGLMLRESFLLLLKEPFLMDMTLLKLLKIMVQKLLFPIRISTQTYH